MDGHGDSDACGMDRADRTRKNGNGALRFYPETGEFVVLRSGYYGLEKVKCP